jgi:hypothetical protein
MNKQEQLERKFDIEVNFNNGFWYAYGEDKFLLEVGKNLEHLERMLIRRDRITFKNYQTRKRWIAQAF